MCKGAERAVHTRSIPWPCGVGMLRFAHPAHHKTKKGGGALIDASVALSAPRQTGVAACRRLGRGARRGQVCATLRKPIRSRGALVYRRSAAALTAANQRRRSAPNALPGTRLKSGRYPPPPVPVQRLASQTGRDAGRAYCQSRPGAGCVVPPAGTAPAPLSRAPSRKALDERDAAL